MQADTSSPRAVVGGSPEYGSVRPAEGAHAAVEMTDAEAQEHADEMDPQYPAPAAVAAVAEVGEAVEVAPAKPARVDPKTLPSEATASDGFVHVKWRGLAFEFPVRRGAWDMNVQFAFEEGLRNRGLFILLGGGPDDADNARAKLYTVAKTRDELDEFTDFLSAAMLEHCE